MVRDLSEDGFSLRAMMPMRVGDENPFVLALDESLSIEGRGKVADVEESGFVCSIDFLDLPEATRNQIRQWLDESEKHTMRGTAPAVGSDHQTMEDLRRELREGIPERPAAAAPAPIEFEPLPEVPAVAAEPLKDLVAGEHEPLVLMQPLSHDHGNPIPGASEPSVTVEPPAALPQVEASEAGEPAAAPRILVNWTDVTRAVLFMLLIAGLVGGYVFRRNVGQALVNLGQRLAGSEQAHESAEKPIAGPVTQSAGTESDVGNSSAEKNAADAKPGTNTPAQPAPATEPNKSGAAAATQLPPATQPNAATSAPSQAAVPASQSPARAAGNAGGAASDAGQSEYQQAQSILRGKNRDADLGEAVRLLWVSVEKGNAAAEVSLADLYKQGQGVVKNCDQAHILLTAAARKGNSEAQRQLNIFESEGCE